MRRRRGSRRAERGRQLGGRPWDTGAPVLCYVGLPRKTKAFVTAPRALPRGFHAAGAGGDGRLLANLTG